MEEPNSGETFGHFEVVRKIGVGGMGVVYLARDKNLNRQVALKVVSANLAEDEQFRERFHREAETLARLDSPHIVHIYDHGQQGSTPYIATQLVAGGDLGRLIQERGSLGPTLAGRVCSQIADALGDAHRAGVIHRDVKTSNVLIRDPNNPEIHAYLCDFGIAQTECRGLTTAGAVAGTWAYLAPERAQGAPANPSTDIYSLGCLFWACLTGRAPYEGSDVEVAMAHMRAPIPQLPGNDPLTGRVNIILARAMAKNPAERYANASLLRNDLRELSTFAGTVRPLPPHLRPGQKLPPMGPGAGQASQGSHGSQGSFAGRQGRPPAAAFSGGPSGPGQGYAAAGPSYGGAPPPGKNNKGLMIGIGALVVAVLGGISLVAWLSFGGDDEPDPSASGSPSASTSGSPSTDPSPSDPSDTASSSAPPKPKGPPANDFNGDKLGDILFSSTGGNKPRVEYLPSDGKSGFGERKTLITGQDTALTGDIDGNGRTDILALVATSDF